MEDEPVSSNPGKIVHFDDNKILNNQKKIENSSNLKALNDEIGLIYLYLKKDDPSMLIHLNNILKSLNEKMIVY